MNDYIIWVMLGTPEYIRVESPSEYCASYHKAEPTREEKTC